MYHTHTLQSTQVEPFESIESFKAIARCHEPALLKRDE